MTARHAAGAARRATATAQVTAPTAAARPWQIASAPARPPRSPPIAPLPTLVTKKERRGSAAPPPVPPPPAPPMPPEPPAPAASPHPATNIALKRITLVHRTLEVIIISRDPTSSLSECPDDKEFCHPWLAGNCRSVPGRRRTCPGCQAVSHRGQTDAPRD